MTQSQAREWVSADGKRTFHATLVEYQTPKVKLQRSDGVWFEVNESILSAADRQYCRVADVILNNVIPDARLEVVEVVEEGAFCKIQPGPGKTDENYSLFLWHPQQSPHAVGDKIHSHIYWAGTYYYKAKGGDVLDFTSYTKDLDSAVAIWNDRISQGGSPAPGQPEQSQLSTGTCFAISKAGHLVTNSHVVEHAVKIMVKIDDHLALAKLLIADEVNDLALLKVEVPTIPLHLGTLSTPKLGDDVTAAGYPLPKFQGTSLKLTRGVISSMKGLQDDVRYYQIDAAVQPGNSGGPLLLSNGLVIGVVSLRLSHLTVLAETNRLPENVNCAIKLSYLNPLIESVKGLVRMLPSGAPNKEMTLGEMLEQSTHMVISEFNDGDEGSDEGTSENALPSLPALYLARDWYLDHPEGGEMILPSGEKLQIDLEQRELRLLQIEELILEQEKRSGPQGRNSQ